MPNRIVNAVFVCCNELESSALLKTVAPTDADLASRLELADLVLVDLQALPMVDIPRRHLYQILHSKTSIFLYPRYHFPDYNQIRMAYRSGATDVVPMPEHLTELGFSLDQCVQAVEAHSLDPR